MKKNHSLKCYQLHIRVQKPVVIGIGKLGRFEFPPGDYIYTGSGKRNLDRRLSRHLLPSKRLRWHIDYLLSDPEVKVTGYLLFEELECEINQKTAGDIIVPRFGATDCRSGCGSHLKFLGTIQRPHVDQE